ncbi:MAG: helix-turn-helix transcriptional regulator, partial [Thermodesulfobacteriota bacterium]
IKLRDLQSALFTCSITAAILPGEGERPPRIVGSIRDITERKRAEETLRQREEELSIKSRNLEEVNTALKVLLKQREEDRKEMEENVLANVKTSILPYIEKVKESPLTHHQKACLEILEAQMKKIISPFLRRISQACFDLTPQEIRVADFVKNGNTTKEIADILVISIKTVDYHRDNIRRKLGIKNHHTNLRSFLLKLS